MVLELTHFNLATRYCSVKKQPATCQTVGNTDICACDSDLCNTSVKLNVSMVGWVDFRRSRFTLQARYVHKSTTTSHIEPAVEIQVTLKYGQERHTYYDTFSFNYIWLWLPTFSDFYLINCAFGVVALTNFGLHNVLKIQNKCMIAVFYYGRQAKLTLLSLKFDFDRKRKTFFTMDWKAKINVRTYVVEPSSYFLVFWKIITLEVVWNELRMI